MLNRSKLSGWSLNKAVQSLSTGSAANLIYDPQRTTYNNGDLIASITDVVGGSIQATASGAQRPSLALSTIDGRKVIRFNGSMELNTASTSVDPRNFTMVFVTDFSNYLGGSGNGQNILAAFGGGATRSVYYNNASATVFDVSTLAGYGGTFNAGTYNIITVVGNASNLIVRANGLELFNSPAMTATPNFTNIRLGRAESLVQSLVGDLAYFELYNSALDSSGRAANETRLRNLLPVMRINGASKNYFYFGNSLTEGRGNTARSTRWAELSQSGSNLSNKNNFLVRAYAGATTVQLNGAASAIFTPYLPSSSSNTYVFVWEISNEVNAGSSGATAYANLTTLCQTIKTAAPNAKTIVMTMLPRGASGTVETNRLAANTLVMAGTSAIGGVTNCYTKGTDSMDYVFDVSGISTIGTPGSQSNTTYYQSDQIHLTDTGYALIGTQAASMVNYTGTL